MSKINFKKFESRKNVKTIFQIYLIILKHRNSPGIQNWVKIEPIKRLTYNTYLKNDLILKHSSKTKSKKSKTSKDHRKKI